MEISVLDPGGNINQRWYSQGSYLGIVSQEFYLSPSPAIGQWAVVTTINGLTDEKVFMVENPVADPSMFNLKLETAPEILAGEGISGTVRTKWVHSAMIYATLSVNVTRISAATAPVQLFLSYKGFYVEEQFFFSKVALASLYEPGDEDITLNITASVTESSTGFTEKRVVAVRVLQNAFKLQFRDFPQVLKPSLSFFAKLEISMFDGMPLAPQALLNSASVVVVQKTSHAEDQTESTTLPVVEGGVVLIRFTLQANISMLIINATFMSSKKTLNLFSKFPSATGSYVQIEPSSFLPAQIGSSHEINVESTFQLAELHYVVSARGQVFTAGTQVASSSLWLTPMVSWFPEVCVTVYCVLPDGEVISDTLLVPIQQPNHVSLKWNEDLTGHNRSVSFTVTVQDPRSQVLILVTTGTPEAHLPLEDWLTNRDTECNTVVLSDGQLLGAGAAVDNLYNCNNSTLPIAKA
ncbi:CD109 antigen-like [Gadus chalcogrammus]|uniref:CD109 antigen-like n=1 Tax=Gadus chalcogrammus TaxID=1042646 RepID=UPI0024C3A5DF|nr:CD109 antigen-like [Gadus chalcogrammus]